MKIKFNNVERQIDDAKVAEGLNALATHAGTMPGTDGAMIINGVTYNVGGTSYTTPKATITTGLGEYKANPSTFASTVTKIEETVINFISEGGNVLPAGLYDENDVLVASWEELGIDTSRNFTAMDTMMGTTLPKNKLNNYTNGVKLVIPNDVLHIGNYVFSGCTNLKNVTFSENATSIGDYVLQGCTNLESVTIGHNVTSIGNGAFERCSSFINVIIPDSVTSIGSNAFNNCSSLASITIGDSVTSIGSQAFQGCGELRSIIIPESLTNISDNMFNGCVNLTSVIIPNTVTSIGDGAFDFCLGLIDVYYTGTEEEWNVITMGMGNNALTNATIHYNYVA